MHHVRADYFWYEKAPRYERGIRARDLLVFRHTLDEGETRDAPDRRDRARGAGA